jgi:hypothetical protein
MFGANFSHPTRSASGWGPSTGIPAFGFTDACGASGTDANEENGRLVARWQVPSRRRAFRTPFFPQFPRFYR